MVYIIIKLSDIVLPKSALKEKPKRSQTWRTDARIGGYKKGEEHREGTTLQGGICYLYHVFRDRDFQIDLLWWTSIAVQDETVRSASQLKERCEYWTAPRIPDVEHQWGSLVLTDGRGSGSRSADSGATDCVQTSGVISPPPCHQWAACGLLTGRSILCK